MCLLVFLLYVVVNIIRTDYQLLGRLGVYTIMYFVWEKKRVSGYLLFTFLFVYPHLI